MATPPYGDPNHQHNSPKTPRDGAIHNSVLLLNVHVADTFNPGQFTMKCAHKPNVSAYHTGETTSTEKRLDDGSTLTPIVSAIRRSHTDESDLQKSSAPPFLNGMGRPQISHSSSHKLRLTSPRHIMQASNIGLERLQQQNTRASELALTCSPPYLTPYLQCF